MDEAICCWRGEFGNSDVNRLHAEASDRRPFTSNELDWVQQCEAHSLGWVTARVDSGLVGFVNIPWDGLTHAWIQDEMVALTHRGRGIGVALIHAARDGAKAAGCEWLHVDFDDRLREFYFDAAGFTPTSAGLIDLTKLD